MKELSLNVLDIAENSVKAGATLIQISINENSDKLILEITDDGCGMKAEMLENVVNPFCTTRTTRKVGLGIPLLKMASEQTGGELAIQSRHVDEFPSDHGTTVRASFLVGHIDFTPLGDIISTIVTLIQGSPDIDFLFNHTKNGASVCLDTRQIREVLGDEIPLNEIEILSWIKENLREQYSSI